MRTLTYARFGLWIGLAALTLGLAGIANAQYAYDITPIGGVPEGLNNLGQVVGYYYPPNASLNRAFEYSNGQMRDLLPNDPSGGSANAINDRGQIAGGNGNGPFVYDSNTATFTSLGLTQNDYANAINQSGQVAGTYLDASLGGPTHAYVYSIDTKKFQDITRPTSGYTTAVGINNLGQVIGDTVFPNQNYTSAYLYSNGVTQNLGAPAGYIGSDATGINDSGEVVGYADAGGNTPTHAFLYRNGAMTDLGLLFGPQTRSFAFDINNAGDVVGSANFGGFLYHNGQAEYLNDLIDPSLGWSITSATAINDRGQIIGTGNFGGFIMTPHVANTPAPGSLVVAVVGIGLLAGRLRRRSR